jgi:hypothetical protein
MLKRVTRVYAALALDGGSHARCTMYLEYDVEQNPRPPSLTTALDLCRSMSPAP